MVHRGMWDFCIFGIVQKVYYAFSEWSEITPE